MVVYLSAKATSCACLEHALHNAHLCYDECKHTASVVMNANSRPSEDESETILQYSGLAAGTKSNNKRNNRIAASSHEDRRREEGSSKVLKAAAYTEENNYALFSLWGGEPREKGIHLA